MNRRAALLPLLLLLSLGPLRADDSVDKIPFEWKPFARTKHARLVRVLGQEKPLSDRFVHLAVSPDGKLVSFNQKLMEIASRKVVLEMKIASAETHPDQCAALILNGEGIRRFSPDGRRVIAGTPELGGADWPVAVAWDLKAGAESRFTAADGNTGAPIDIAFVQSSAVAVVGCNSGGVWLWATDGSRPPRKLLADPEQGKNVGERGVHSVDVAPDGKRALTCAGHEIALWDLGTGKPKLVQKGSQAREKLPFVLRAVFTRDGKDALTLDAKGAVRKVNLGTGAATQLGEVPADEGWTTMSISQPCVFTRDRRLLVASSGRDKVLSVFDLASGTVIDRIELGPVSDQLTDMVLAPDDRTLYVGTRETKKILVFELSVPSAR